jgi:hypothetical protein
MVPLKTLGINKIEDLAAVKENASPYVLDKIFDQSKRHASPC